MKKVAKNFAYLLVFAVMAACSSSSNEGEPILLGSFQSTFDPVTSTVTTEKLAKSETGIKVGHGVTTGRPNALLDYSDSVLINNTYVDVENCAPSNWNGATMVLSNNFRIENLSANTIITPIELRLTGITDIDRNPNPNVVDEVNTDLAGAACDSPITLSNCDSNTDGNFDIIWPYETPSNIYSNDPGWDFSLLLYGDNKLDPFDNDPLTNDDISECNFLQFNLNSATEFTFYYDVLGKIQGSSLAAPTVTYHDPADNSTLASPSAINPIRIRAVLDTGNGADTVRITGGPSPTTCADGDACDQNATSGTVDVDYTVNTNTTQNISTFQIDTDPDPDNESSANVDSWEHDSTGPSIISIDPPNGSINFSPSGNLLITFDGDLEVSSVSTTTVLLNRDGGVGDCSTFGANVGRTVSQPNSDEIKIDPSSDLLATEIYCIRIVGLTSTCDGTDEIRDDALNCFAATQTSKFTTASGDSAAPEVLFTSPTDGSVDIPTNTSIQVTFNEAMDDTTITNSAYFTLTDGGTPISGTRTLSANGKTATFTPSSNLSNSTQYTITLTTDIADLAGNTLALEYTAVFTTGAATDTTSPNIVSFLPEDGASNVNENVNPQITFSEPMDPSTINATTVHVEKKSDSTPIPASVLLSANGITATIVPNDSLENNTLYLISVEFGCKDIAGNNLASPQTSEFTTQVSADTTAPTISQVTPADNSVDVSIYTGIVIVFSEAIDPATVHTGTFQLLDETCTTTVPGTVTVADDNLSATYTQLSAPLTKNTNYCIKVIAGSSGVKDPAGNALAADFTSSINTEFQDVTDAEVVVVAPDDGQTSVPVNANIVLQYSEPLQAATISDTSVKILNGATQVTGLLRLLPDGINVRFNPDSDLAANTTYTIETTSAVKDLANRSAAVHSSTFTTDAGGATDTDGPTLSSVSMDGDTVNIAPTYTTNLKRWPNIQLTFNESIDPSTVTDSNLELIKNSDSSKVSTRLAISPNSTIVDINPVNLLDNNATYTVNVKTGLRNLAGFALQSFTTFELTTLDNSSDTTAPYIVSVNPADGTNNVAVDQVITITMSEAIDPDTAVLGNFTVTLQATGNPPPKGDMAISLDATRKIITLTPETDYQNNKNYEIRVVPLIVDDANNTMDCTNPPAAGNGCDSPQNPTEWSSDFST